MEFGFNNDTADIMIIGALGLVVVLLAVCIGSGLKPIERSECRPEISMVYDPALRIVRNESEHHPEASVAYETATQREIELQQEVERLRLKLAKSGESKTAVYYKDSNETAKSLFMIGGIILALTFGIFMIWTIIEMPPTVP